MQSINLMHFKMIATVNNNKVLQEKIQNLVFG